MVQMEFLGMDFSCVYGSLSDGKFPKKDCLLPLISKLLGYAIFAASTTVKVPQILKIIQHKSVRGLSVVAFEMEVVGYTIALAYCLHKGLPFSAYGELAFLLNQVFCNAKSLLFHGIAGLILVATIYYFSQHVGNSTWIRALLYCGIAPTILAGKIDLLLFEALYVLLFNVISGFSPFHHMWPIYQLQVVKLRKNKGMVSFDVDSAGAGAGDIISIAGLKSPSIGHTVASVEINDEREDLL